MRHVLILLVVFAALFPRMMMAEAATAQIAPDLQQHNLAGEMLALGLNKESVESLAAAMTTARFSGEDAGQIVAQMRLVQGDREALAAITGKIHEGIAKQVAPGSIVRAVTRVRERHTLAKATAQSVAAGREDRLSPVIADAMVSGLGQSELGQIVQGLEARTQEMGKEGIFHLSLETMMAVRDMVRYGVQPTTATAVTTKALSLGYGSDEMGLVRQLFHDQRMQGDVDAFSQRMLQGLNQGLRAGELHGFARGDKSGSSGNRGGNGSGGSSGGGSGGGSGHGGGSGGGGGSGHGGGSHGGGR